MKIFRVPVSIFGLEPSILNRMYHNLVKIFLQKSIDTFYKLVIETRF